HAEGADVRADVQPVLAVARLEVSPLVAALRDHLAHRLLVARARAAVEDQAVGLDAVHPSSLVWSNVSGTICASLAVRVCLARRCSTAVVKQSFMPRSA